MTQLTGSQFGTGQDDSFIGEVTALGLTEDTTESGILFANINAFGGNDTIEGTVTLTLAGEEPLDVNELTSFGIQQSIIDTGNGNDTVRAASDINGDSFRAGTPANRVTSFGFARGSLNGRGGDDNFMFISESGLVDISTSTSTSLSGATVDSGSGNDTITLESIAESISFDVSGLAEATGAEDATLKGGSGEDVFDIAVRSNGADSGEAIGLNRSFLSGDVGSDRITIAADTDANVSAESIGVLEAQVAGGADDDVISVTARGASGGRDTVTEVTGIGNNATVSGGLGNDTITSFASTLASTPSSANSDISGARNATAKGGAGNDTIELKAENGTANGAAYGALNTRISGGAGNDSLRFIAENAPDLITGADLFGLADSHVLGGDGDDTIEATGVNVEGFNRTAYGIFNSRINGGNGNDRILASVGDRGTLDIQDAIIGGGLGDDFFDVGMGSGTIRGGEGNDTAILDFFDFDTMTLETVNGGLRVSGSQDNSGNELAWTQNIFGVEQFQIGGVAISMEALMNEIPG